MYVIVCHVMYVMYVMYVMCTHVYMNVYTHIHVCHVCHVMMMFQMESKSAVLFDAGESSVQGTSTAVLRVLQLWRLNILKTKDTHVHVN